MAETLGVYISVPFCRAKCSYCNFASGVFGPDRMDRYVERVVEEVRALRERVGQMGLGVGGVALPDGVDTVFLGGGTPSLLSSAQMRRLFAALRDHFTVSADAEITLECAPGQLAEETLEALLSLGLNRVSFGVQSFVDREAAAVGRLHTREMCLAELDRMRAVGLGNLNVDLIVGLPHQTRESWAESLEVAIASGVPHASVYMLEVDEDSRLGREMLQQGTRYGAAAAASEDETADWYAWGCDRLAAAGLAQYEISNFAQPGFASAHNEKYWTRRSYLGFGLDAHSMLRARDGVSAARWANGDDLDRYLDPAAHPMPGESGQRDGSTNLRVLPAASHTAPVEIIGREAGFEEALFLGLRRAAGVELAALKLEFGAELVQRAVDAIGDVEQAGLIERRAGCLRLTGPGRMVSNEVFSRLLVAPV